MAFNKNIALFTLIGLILGIILDQFLRNGVSTLFYHSLVVLVCYLFVLAYNEKNSLRLLLSSVIVAFLLSVPLIGINYMSSIQDYTRWITFFAAFPVFVYIGHCFHYASHHENTWKVSYPALFAAVWNTLLLLAFAAIFASLAHFLIMLAAYVFKTVGNEYLWNWYFTNIHFRLICTVTLFFMGIGIGQQNIEIIYNLRFLLLKMMYVLFPFLALISTVYFILYLGHSLSNQPDYIEPLVILVPLIILGILFFNAYFQDGSSLEKEPLWLKISLRVYRVVLFMLVLCMVYKLFQQIPLDINVLICLALVSLFSFIYAISAFFPEASEIPMIRHGNIFAALFFMSALFFANLPYMPIHYTTNPYQPVHTLAP